jgi:hypothetical protein
MTGWVSHGYPRAPLALNLVNSSDEVVVSQFECLLRGGFATVRFRARNLESGRSAYGVVGPEAEWQLLGLKGWKEGIAMARSAVVATAGGCRPGRDGEVRAGGRPNPERVIATYIVRSLADIARMLLPWECLSQRILR